MQGWIRRDVERLGNSLRWSWAGLCAAWATQRSLRQWVGLNVISAGFALALDLTGAERGLILALGVLVLAAELFNTAIEAAVDYISLVRDPRAALVKDCASAGVALTALAAGTAWIAVLWG